jgi:hypothetical protein
MWVTCHNCNGDGFKINNYTIKGQNRRNNFIPIKKIPCNICNPRRYIIDTIMLGQIWVNDNYFPITPPNSP